MRNSQVIYKYRDWTKEHHRSILMKNELYFAFPSEINDPFDFKISIDLNLLDTFDKKNQFVETLIAESLDILIERKIDPQQKKLELLHRLHNNPNKLQEEYETTEFTQVNLYFGIISFSLRWDSILLWSHYANNHKGFCIGFNKKEMENSELFGSYGPVHYLDYYPKIDPLKKNEPKSMVIRSHTKAKEWFYEEEYRFVQVFDVPNLSPNERTIEFPDKFINEIILGMSISDDHKNEITSICQSRNIPVFQIIKRPQSYILERL